MSNKFWKFSELEESFDWIQGGEENVKEVYYLSQMEVAVENDDRVE